MNANIAYISWNGIDEPLVHSQVLQYLFALGTKGFNFYLFTAENKIKASHEKTRQQLKSKGIIWQPIYKGPLKNIGQVWRCVAAVKKCHKEVKFDLLHARSYFSGVCARRLKKNCGLKYVYDNRGFWVDEKAYKGSLIKGSLLYKLLKRIDLSSYTQADGLVSLTEKGIEHLTENYYLVNGKKIPPFKVIPTCVNGKTFNIKGHENTFVYLGSIGQGYMGDEIFALFALLQKHFPGYGIKLISQSSEQLIQAYARKHGVDTKKMKMLKLAHQQVPAELSKGGIGISFIKPHVSKLASCPTKIGEYLASGMPVICNRGIGDMDEVLSAGVSVFCDGFEANELLAKLNEVIKLHANEQSSLDSRALAQSYFSLQNAVNEYSALYNELLVSEIL